MQAECTPDEALVLMTERAKVSGQRREQIADDVVERRMRFSAMDLTGSAECVEMGISKGRRRKSPRKQHDPIVEERNQRVSLSPRKPESLWKTLLRSPPRRAGGNPG